MYTLQQVQPWVAKYAFLKCVSTYIWENNFIMKPEGYMWVGVAMIDESNSACLSHLSPTHSPPHP